MWKWRLAIVLIAILVTATVVGRTFLSPGSASNRTTPTAASGATMEAQSGAGAITQWYELYFTDPKYPDDPKNHRGGIDEKLVALMDRSQRTMDVADYDFDLANVAEAMVRAKKRGVRVRMVTDTDTLTNTKDKRVQSAFSKLKAAGIPIVDDQRPAIMHDKFTVVDDEWVSAGSWNYTDGDTYHLNNWMGIFHSEDLAANYAAEFEQMFAHKFGPAKSDVAPHPSLTIEGVAVKNRFSPKGDCADLIIDTIQKETKKSVYFMAFSFTHDGIGQAIIDKQKQGVSVSGVFETSGSQTQFSEYGKMKKAGLDVYTDGNPWSMHHKVIIIDERIVIVGSFNFSSSADKENDENLLIIDDPGVAKAFKGEFDKVLDAAKHPRAKS
ncbi:MAG: phospholipase D-like domain-containing protein [Chloroflexi bacterium]|nr:phospholipase D-like domain-containing protein [Chloroflexota bacterium]